jgi:hypothetical protein
LKEARQQRALENKFHHHFTPHGIQSMEYESNGDNYEICQEHFPKCDATGGTLDEPNTKY